MEINWDEIAPPKNSFRTSRVIFQSARYVACITSAGLIIQSHHAGTGSCMQMTHPQYSKYVSAIEESLPDEADDLCRVFLRRY